MFIRLDVSRITPYTSTVCTSNLCKVIADDLLGADRSGFMCAQTFPSQYQSVLPKEICESPIQKAL